MKHFFPFNKNGKIEISENQLKKMLADSYKEGYVQGQIDHVLNTAPDFAIADERSTKKEKTFFKDKKVLIFRANIL